MITIRKSEILPLVLVLICFLVSLWHLLIVGWGSISELDGFSRVNTAFYDRNILSPIGAYGPWLPLYSRVLALALNVFPDNHISPRLFSYLLSLCGVWLVFLYTKRGVQEKFGERTASKIAFISAVIYLFLPYRLILASQPLTESISAPLLLLSFYLARSYKYPLIPVLFFMLGQGIRYEFWFMTPLFLYVLMRGKSYRKEINTSLVLLTISFPIYWMSLNYLTHGDALNFFKEKYLYAIKVGGERSEVEYFHLWLAIKAWITKLFTVFPLSILSISVLGMISSLKRKTFLFPSILFGYLFLTLIFQVYLGTMEWLPVRYLFGAVIFLVVYVGIGFIEVDTHMRLPKLWRIGLWAIVGVILASRYVYWWKQADGAINILPKEQWHMTEEAASYYRNRNLGKYKTVMVTSKAEMWYREMFIYESNTYAIDHEFPDQIMSQNECQSSVWVILNKYYPKFPCQNSRLLYKNELLSIFLF